MIKELRYNGVTASPSDYACADGDLSVAMNLWHENGSIKPALQPLQILSLSANQSVMFVHTTHIFKHYIIYDSLNHQLYWVDDNARTSLVAITVSGITASNPVLRVTGIGGTIIILTAANTYYLLWKQASGQVQAHYKLLGDHIPEYTPCFKLESAMERSEVYKFEEDLKGSEQARYVAGEAFSNDDATKITNQVMSKVNKFVNEKGAKDGKFIFPFFVRCAFRLYDRTLVRHSAPVLMMCASDTAPLVYRGNWSDGDDFYFVVAAAVHSLKFYMNCNGIGEWSDIIRSIDIFVSAPMFTYDQNGLCTRFVTDNFTSSISPLASISRMTNPVSPYTDINAKHQWIEQSRMYKYAFSNNPAINTPTGQGEFYYNQRVELPSKDLGVQIESCSQFFFIKSLELGTNGVAETLVDIPKDYLTSLVNREVMGDDYDSNDRKIFTNTFNYNSRLNLAGLKKVLFLGYPPLSSQCYSNGYRYFSGSAVQTDRDYTCQLKFYVHIRKEHNADIVVKYDDTAYSNLIGNETFGKFLFFYYPDPDAYKVTIEYIKQNVSTRIERNLKTHDFLAGAYLFLKDYTPVTEGATIPSVSGIADRTVELSNKLYTSEVNNPFAFPVGNIKTIGTGDIIALGAAAKPLSQGQFGQFPMYAFCSDGVWALAVSDTGTFLPSQPVSRDVCIDRDAIAQLNDCVVFATRSGVMQISGSTVIPVTDVIDNGNDAAFSFSSLPQSAAVLFNGSIPAYCQFVSFRTYLAGVRMLYDDTSRRLILFNPLYRYCYVLAIKEKQWSMIEGNISKAVNSYPEALAMTNDNKLIDYSARETNTTLKGQYLVTRPLKLDVPDDMKTISDIIQRGLLSDSSAKVLLYGSRDLTHWFPVHSSNTKYLRGFSGTGYKYFRIVLSCTMTDAMGVNGCTISYRPRETDRLR